MDYEKKYKEALERAQQIKDGKDEWRYSDLSEITPALTEIFQELAESEDERIRKELKDAFEAYDIDSMWNGIPIRSIFAWIEKQKELPTNEEMLRTLRTEYEKGVADTIAKYEQKEQKPAEYLDKDMVYAIMKKLHDLAFSQRILINSDEYKKINEITSDVRSLLDYPIEQKPAEPSNDELERHQKELYDFKVFAAKQAREHHISFVHDFEWNNFCAEILSYFNEQKPTSTEDMPYIADEHFFEREPKDSFKYKLAEYMTKCCTKKEGQYGYEYGISAETVLKMAEEELLKRGVVQKPVEWSEEDESILEALIYDIERLPMQGVLTHRSCDSYIKFLKALRPGWKPSEEQMEALNALNCHGDLSYVGQQNQLISLYNDLKKLM